MKNAVGLFFAMSTQWHWASAGMAGAFRTGLNYGTLDPTAVNSGIPMTTALFDDIRTLELASLDAWNRKSR